MPFIRPSEEQMAAVLAFSATAPIWMLNLLRFTEEGAAMYQRYAEAVIPMIEKRGGKILFRSRVHLGVIGPKEEKWDEAILVMYQTKEAFFEMVQSAEYEAIAHQRDDALVDSRLYLSTEVPTPG